MEIMQHQLYSYKSKNGNQIQNSLQYFHIAKSNNENTEQFSFYLRVFCIRSAAGQKKVKFLYVQIKKFLSILHDEKSKLCT
jgi:hypothetical protein